MRQGQTWSSNPSSWAPDSTPLSTILPLYTQKQQKSKNICNYGGQGYLCQSKEFLETGNLFSPADVWAKGQEQMAAACVPGKGAAGLISGLQGLSEVMNATEVGVGGRILTFMKMSVVKA